MIELKSTHIFGVVRALKSNNLTQKAKEFSTKYQDVGLDMAFDVGFEVFVDLMADPDIENCFFDILEVVGVENPRDLGILELVELLKDSDLKKITQVFQSALTLVK